MKLKLARQGRVVTSCFREFSKYVHLWSTFNEINVMAFCGYLYGHFPPAKLASYKLAGTLFLNCLRAHTAANKAIKSLPGELAQYPKWLSSFPWQSLQVYEFILERNALGISVAQMQSRNSKHYRTAGKCKICSTCIAYLIVVLREGRGQDWLWQINVLVTETCAEWDGCVAEGASASIGIVHNYLQYEVQYPESISKYYIGPICKMMSSIWGNTIMLRYFKEGIFEWPSPFGGNTVEYKEPSKPGCDWIGINYYGRCSSSQGSLIFCPDFLYGLAFRHAQFT